MAATMDNFLDCNVKMNLPVIGAATAKDVMMASN